MPRPTARPRLDKKNSQWLPQLSRSCDIFNDTITATQDTDLANTSKIQAKIMRVKHVCTNDQHCLDLRKYKKYRLLLKSVHVIVEWPKVSLLGVDSLWDDCTFIPADWGSWRSVNFEMIFCCHQIDQKNYQNSCKEWQVLKESNQNNKDTLYH